MGDKGKIGQDEGGPPGKILEYESPADPQAADRWSELVHAVAEFVLHIFLYLIAGLVIMGLAGMGC